MHQSVHSHKVHHLFWFITIGIALTLTLPVLIQDGMFIDGVLYSAVSHNLANGIGSFWFPSFSYNNMAGIQDSFHEQPPLVFAIQAIFYKVLGDSMYVERFYTLLMLFLNLWLIKKLWEYIFRNEKSLKEISWLPAILWITIPVCFWSFTHNMHENTVSVFILSSMLFLFKAFDERTTTRFCLMLVASGIFIFLASFSKGVPGLFPIAAPAAFILYKKTSLRKVIGAMFILLVTVSAIYSLLLLSDDARRSLYNYVYLRLFKRINDVPTTNTYFDTLFRLIQESLIMAGLVIMTRYYYAKQKLNRIPLDHAAYTFFVIGLIGILPLMLTLVQKGFYMLPALPYIAFGFALLMANETVFLLQKAFNNPKREMALKNVAFGIALLAIILTISKVGKYSRNEELLSDIHRVGALIPKHEVINCTYDLQKDWSLQTYFSRYYFISLDTNSPHDYYLSSRQEFEQHQSELLSKYMVVSKDLGLFVVLKRK